MRTVGQITSYKLSLRVLFKRASDKSGIFIDIKRGGFATRDEAYTDALGFVVTLLNAQGVKGLSLATIPAYNYRNGYIHLVKVKGMTEPQPMASANYRYVDNNSGIAADWSIMTQTGVVNYSTL